VSKCIAGREVVINLRDRRTGVDEAFHLVCPTTWTRHRLLTYCRSEHPECTVRILEWYMATTEDRPWKIRLWLVNPEEAMK
jgi:hypothetical protein